MQNDNPIKIKAIDHLVIATADIPRLQKFYESVLGCHVERTLPNLGLVQMRAGQAMIDLVPYDGDNRPGQNMEHFCLLLEEWDLKAIKTHLMRNGVSVEGPSQRYGATGMGPSLYISDPDGNQIEIKGM